MAREVRCPQAHHAAQAGGAHVQQRPRWLGCRGFDHRQGRRIRCRGHGACASACEQEKRCQQHGKKFRHTTDHECLQKTHLNVKKRKYVV
jgi:hypothetical protein